MVWSDAEIREYLNRMPLLVQNGWNISAENGYYLLTLPNGAVFTLNQQDLFIDWAARTREDNFSANLWLRSLFYIETLAQRREYALVAKIWHSYFSFLSEQSKEAGFFKINSVDHQIALNILVLSKLRLIYQLPEHTDAAQCFSETAVLSELAFLEQIARNPDLFHLNNHGLFLCVALLASRLVWPELDPHRPSLREDLSHLAQVIDECIDFTGLVVENTPGYQQLWVYLLRQVKYVLDLFDIDDQSSKAISAFAEKVEQVYSLYLLPGNFVPPLGDSSLAPELELRRAEGEFHSDSCGSYVSNRGDYYIHFKAGAKLNTHKQLDDLSLYVAYKGKTVIGDAGLLNYDGFDYEAMMARGQLGHSGLFFPQLDGVVAHYFYQPEREPLIHAHIQMHDICEYGYSVGFAVSGSAEYEASQLKRLVLCPDAGHFIVHDMAKSPHYIEAVQRFLIPAGFTVSRTGVNQLVFSNEDVDVQLDFGRITPRDTVTIREASYWPNGFIVERAFHIDGCERSVEITVEDGQEKDV